MFLADGKEYCTTPTDVGRDGRRQKIYLSAAIWPLNCPTQNRNCGRLIDGEPILISGVN